MVKPLKNWTTKMLVLTGVFMAALPVSAAEVYRWVDENGVTHYSQTPPKSREAKRVDVDVPRPPDSEIDRSVEQLEALSERNEGRREARKKEKEREAEEAEKQAYLEKRCEDLRSSLKELKNNRRLLTPDADGDARRMSEEERRERINKRQQQIRKECD